MRATYTRFNGEESRVPLQLGQARRVGELSRVEVTRVNTNVDSNAGAGAAALLYFVV